MMMMTRLSRVPSSWTQWFQILALVLTTLFFSASVQGATISAGGGHGVALKADNSLWALGLNDSGQLGDGTTMSRLSPVLVGNGYSAVAAGSFHTIALKSDGSLWAWGKNQCGQLGDGTTTTRVSPVLIGTGYSALSAGSSHTLAVKSNGTLWAWGCNNNGQLGDGTMTNRLSPVLVGSGFSAVAAGTNHTVALKSDGSLWAWGGNGAGQLGDGTTTGRFSPVLIGNGYHAVEAGLDYTIALKSDGSLWAWGTNDYGQLGDSTTINRRLPVLVGNGYKAVSAGERTTVAIKTDGSLWAWGASDDRQLGESSTAFRTFPIQVGNNYSAVAAGGNQVIAVKNDGSLWAWVPNDVWQLIYGTTTNHPSPVQIFASGFATDLPPVEVRPQSGWWWNADEPGRGYFIEVKNGRFYTASYVYDNSGDAVWYVTGPGNTSGNTLPGTLSVYNGGQTLTGAYRTPAGPRSIGSMNITFSDSTHGTITWPGGTVPITRYELATGSLNQPDPSFKPETGWWWNASEGGRGFSIEVQGDNLFVGGFMYDGGGNPVWYVSGGKMSNPWVYQGTWAHYVNGQSMGGVFRTAMVKNPNVGGVTIGFTSTTTATMYLPDGRTIPLTRYSL